MFFCLLVLLIVVVSCSDVKVTLCRIRIQLKSKLVGHNGFSKFTLHIVSISQVIKCWSIVVVKLNCFLIRYDRFIVILQHTKCIT